MKTRPTRYDGLGYRQDGPRKENDMIHYQIFDENGNITEQGKISRPTLRHIFQSRYAAWNPGDFDEMRTAAAWIGDQAGSGTFYIGFEPKETK